MTSNNTNERIHYLSLLSIVSAFAVVMLHANGCFWVYGEGRYWYTANIIESVMYFAVPVFFMISGATLLDYQKRYSTKEYLIRRIHKTFLPFLVWSLIGICYALATGNFHLRFGMDALTDILYAIFQTSVTGIFWFFIPLFRIYLLIPLLSRLKEHCTQKTLLVLSILFFIADFVICNILAPSDASRTQIDKSGLYLSYVLVGYLIHQHTISKKARIVIYCAGILGLLVHLFGTASVSASAGMIVQTFKGYANIPCALYSIAIFVFLKEIGSRIRSERILTWIEALSQYTFAIYLLHWFLLDILTRIFHLSIFSIYYRLGLPWIICGLCILITRLIRKIPYIRKILP